MKKLASAALAAGMFLGLGATEARAVPVDIELALLVDVSGSVDANEYTLQLRGYGNALRSAAVQTDILNTANGRIGSIAVTLVQWSSSTNQSQTLNWTLLDSAASINAFADAICPAVGACQARAFTGGTDPDAAITFITPQFASNNFEGTVQVIDVSGDGTGNAVDTRAASDAALAAGVERVNGLAIGDATITNFYNNSIKGGTGAFVIGVNDFADFEAAIIQKLGFEIRNENPNDVPVPATAALFGAALAGLAVARRRKA